MDTKRAFWILTAIVAAISFLSLIFTSGYLPPVKTTYYYIESIGLVMGLLTGIAVSIYAIFSKSNSARKSKLIQFAIFILGTGIMMCGMSLIWMRYEVKNTCQEAELQYEKKDCVEGMIQTLRDERNSYRERNNAVWVMGQLADKRALETLQEFYTGEIPEREPLNSTLSQYELQKAIRWCTEGNVTH